MKNLTLARIFLFLVFFSFGRFMNAQTIYVATTGNDSSDGSQSSPVASFQKAQDLVRTYPSTANVTVIFEDGIYYLPSTIVFNSTDTKASVTYRAANEGKAIISGGSKLSLTWTAYKNGIYVADVAGSPSIDQLYINGTRQRMARFPNAVAGKNVYDTWDLTNGTYNAALDPLTAARIRTWAKPQNGYLHAMHSSLWGDFHYKITAKPTDSTITYIGGWQNNRPSPMHGTFRFVENIFEELDVAGEWYYDSIPQKLYYMPATGVSLATASVEIVRLKNLIEFQGSKSVPVKNVNLNGFVFRHAARTFMENKEPLLRSDWTISRSGAVLYQGAVNCTLSDCEFDQVGGNSVFVSNYNRGISITGCYIHNSGSSGIAFVGDPNSVRSPLFGYVNQNYATMDKTKGPKTDNYPDSCLVENCLITLIGRDEKQTTGVEVSMAHGIHINHCSIYDVPRAGINFSEGTFGGHLIENCDVFNTVLETGDHGSFNSWGRDRYWTPSPSTIESMVTVTPSLPYLDMLDSIVIRSSRFRCDHGWDIDLDDGSTWYRIYNNVLLNGGLKMREGYNRIAYNNVIINNSLNPHVWFNNGADVFKNNIVTTAYKPAAMTSTISATGKWGKELDYNFFAAGIADKNAYSVNGCDPHSINGYPQFVDSLKGNYQVKPTSKALTMGFVNFPMDQFGVQKASLKAIAKTPTLPVFKLNLFTPAQTLVYKYYWLNILLKEPTAEEMSAYGLPFDAGGVAFSSVALGSVAANYGFLSSDLVQSINGTVIKTIAEFRAYIDAHAADSKPQVFTIIRNQQQTTVTIYAPWAKTAVENPSFQIPGRIEGEQYTAMSGVVSETCGDTGGGQNVGYIQLNDWMEYPVNISNTGTYTATFRVACQSTGGTMSLLIDNVSVGTFTFGVTGGWQTYKTFQKDFALTAGTHTLKLLMTAEGYNLNWFQFDAKTTGIHSPENSDLCPSPNPTKGVFSLNTTDNTIKNIQFYTVDGTLVKSIPVTSNLVEISDLRNGIYIARAVNGFKQVYNFKITKY